MGLRRVARRIGAQAARLLMVAASLGLSTPSRAAGPASTLAPAQRFRQANDRARAGDDPGAIAIYQALAAEGHESASLDWNWAQAAAARGAMGEALWALLRARERDPSDRAVARDIERLREGANLDRAEIAPDPLAAAARTSRRLHLDGIALVLMLVSLAAHAGFKAWRSRRLAGAAWMTAAVGVLVACVPLAGGFARPTGVVVRREAPLLDAASTTAQSVATLREGEVVPILEASGDYVRVEDSSGARGWAFGGDVRSLSGAPRH